MSQPLETSYPKQTPQPTDDKAVPKFKVPTEIVDLPSKGLVYPEDSPLASGQVEIKYMTAKEEDILTTESFIQNNIVLDRLLDSVIVTPDVNIRDLVSGDYDALMINTRVLGYGPTYEAKVQTPSGKQQRITVNLMDVDYNELLADDQIQPHVNEFKFTLPKSKIPITFRLLTNKDTKAIEKLLTRTNKSKGTVDKNTSTRLKRQITSVDGERSPQAVADFIDNYMLASDARLLRQHIEVIQPSVDLSVEVVDNETQEPFQVDAPFGPQFLWPDLEA